MGSVKEIKLKKDGHFLFRVLFKPPESRHRHGYPLEIRGLVSPDGKVKISSAEVMLFYVDEGMPEINKKQYSCKIRKCDDDKIVLDMKVHFSDGYGFVVKC